MGWRRYFERDRRDEDLAQEIASYIEHEVEENLARGMNVDEARHAAQRKFGNSTMVREAVYEMNTLTFIESVWQDLKHGVRQLRKNKTFLFTAVPTLALCIGANTAIFSVVSSVILQPLPVPEPERVVTMWNAYPGALGSDHGAWDAENSAPDFFDRRALTDVFESVAAYNAEAYNLGRPGGAYRVDGLRATPSLFHLLRARAMLGRTFTDAEGEPGQGQVVLLSYGLWQELFGGDPAAVGRELRLHGRPYTIVGVMPQDFTFFAHQDQDVRLWTPLAFAAEQRQQYHFNIWNIIARLQPGVTLAQAQARIDALNQRNLDRLPDLKPLLLDAGFHTPVRFFQEELVRDVRGMLFLLWGGVTCVLLIGAVNVANLVLVRATARGREIATRVALGASRGHILRQVLTESLLLAVMGGILGLLIGWAGLGGLDVIGIETLPRSGEIQLDGAAMVFTIGIALAVGLLMALLPAVRILRMSPTAVLREEGRSGTASRGVRLARQGLVVIQVAMALVLLAGAGLLLASFRELLAIDPGFEPRGVLTAQVDLPASRYADAAARRSFVERTLARLRILPGVESVGMTNKIPFGGSYSDSVIFAEGYVPRPGESSVSPSRSVVTPGYFESMGIRVIEGRGFDRRDTAQGRRVIVIDERLAQRFWPEGGTVGQRMWQPTDMDDFRDPSNARYFDIIGIVGSIQMRGVLSPEDQIGAYYFPFAQEQGTYDDFAFTIRTSRDPRRFVEPVRRAIAEVDAELPIFDIRSMDERISRSLTDRRTPMLLTAGFGLLALLLAAIGIYGVLASLVQQRTREIGIRMALGSDRPAIFRLVLREGVVMLGLGVLLGLAGAAALRRAIESHLYGVSPLDPGVLVLVVLLMSGAALAACLVPARRATRVDPASALAEP
ncbi:MAG: FtsX-like permease family protein [Luteitalea sp.]|nr:FtsX-like permease family protein [Luteitalea sp.]